MHFAAVLLQEIAAEGLEGVPLKKLWLCLSSESSTFSLIIDDNVKQFVWRTLVSMKSLSFYVNPEVHEYPVPYDRRSWLLTTDTGVYYNVPPDYPPLKFYPTSDPTDFGSSMFYSTRVDVTSQIRTTDLFHTLENVVSKWGDRLVIVASRHERQNFLLGNLCTSSELSNICYMILEEAARNRYNGLPTTNHDGLGSCGLSPSSIWYARQKLEKLGLITAQPYLSKYKAHSVSTGMLLQHWRFSRHFPFPNAILLQKLLDILHESPTKATTVTHLRHALGLAAKAMKRVLIIATREGFVTISRHQFKECCSYLFRKPSDDLTEGDYQEFAKLHNLQRTSSNLPVALVKLRETALDIKSWLSTFALCKPTSNTKRSVVSGCNAENSEEEEEEEDELECSPMIDDGASIVASSSNHLVEPSDTNGTTILSPLDTSLDISISATSSPSKTASLVGVNPVGGITPTNRISYPLFKGLAVAPMLNPDDSVSVQLAHYLLPCELTMRGLLKVCNLNYFYCRRIVKSFELLNLVRTIKRSSKQTFLLCRQFLTESERLEMLASESMGKSTTKEMITFDVRTQRAARREFILNYLTEHRIVESISKLCHVIWSHEESIGLKTRMDHKSLKRIIDELIKSELVTIRFIKTVRGTVRLLCHPSVSEDDPLLVTVSQTVDLPMGKKKVTFDQGRTVDRAIYQQEQIRLSNLSMQMAKSKLPICPRVRRRLLLHQYLFYVIYSLSEDTKPVHPAVDYLPPIYHDDYSWRRFVAPVGPPKDMSRGWFTATELLRCLPLGLFLYLAGVSTLPNIMCRWLGLNCMLNNLTTEQLEHLDAQLTIDRQQDLPIHELLLLPLNTVQAPGGPFGRLARWLLSAQKLRALLLLLEELTMQNLVSLFELKTPSDSSETCKVLGYLHQNASLLDTRYASPGYRVLVGLKNCYLTRFHFSTEADIASYWQTCEFIAKNTPLGCRSVKSELDNFDLPSTQKKPVPIDTEEQPEIADDGKLPDLHWPHELLSDTVKEQAIMPCGACGFHPTDFTFHGRNWDRKPEAADEHGSSSEDSAVGASTRRCSKPVSSRNAKSVDNVPLAPALSIWQWPQRLFEDVDFQAGFEILPPLPIGARESTPLTKRLHSKRGLCSALKLLERNQPEVLKNCLPETMVALNQDEHSSSQNPNGNAFTSGTIAFTSAQPVKPKHRLNRSAVSSKNRILSAKKLRLSSSIKSFAGRSPRCVWSIVEDQLLVVCRVASVLIAGTKQREFLCVPYLLARDILHRYMPLGTTPKSPAACARRLKYILFSRCTQSTACRILLARVSNQSELQNKYNVGGKQWNFLVREKPTSAAYLFCEAVDRIISTFVPRLNRIRLALIEMGRPPFTEHTATAQNPLDLNAQDNGTLPSSLDPMQLTAAFELQGTRAEMEKQFNFFTLNEKSEASQLHDVAKSRVAVVLYTLYIYVLASFRVVKESGMPFLASTFHRVLRQYPRAQLSQALSLLLASQMVNRVKFSMPEDEYRIFSAEKLKLSARFKAWCYHEFHVKKRHIMDAYQLLKKYMSLIRSTEVPPTDSTPLMVHHFSDHTTGGAVAFYLSMMLLPPQSAELRMRFHISDITFVKDEFIQNEIDKYYSSTSAIEVHNSSDFTRKMKTKDPKGLLNRSLLKRLCHAPSCFGDPRFWSSSGCNRRFRWFDHHLSFTGGQIQLYIHSEHLQSPQTAGSELFFPSATLLQRIDSVVCTVMNNIIPSLDLEYDPQMNLPVGAHADLMRSLEKFIIEGRFTGRTVDELKTALGDTTDLAHVLNVLLESKLVYWLGSTISRFVHRQYLRLWVIHLKSHRAVPSKPNTTNSINQTPPIEPAAKRPRLLVEPEESVELAPTHSPPDQPLDTAEDFDRDAQADDKKLNSNCGDEDVGFFFPECWCAEDGRLKPRYFCGFLQGLISRLTDSPGVTLAQFAMQHQWLFGPQSVRRLIFWLRDMGAVRLCRVVRLTKPALFSAPPRYTISDEPILASPDELTLIPTPHCLSIVGAFCERLLSRTEANNVKPCVALSDDTTAETDQVD